MSIESIVQKESLDKSDIMALLSADESGKQLLFSQAGKIKCREVGEKVYFRGLIEFSNICGKDCYYCGIRRSNKDINRYNLTDSQILEAARIIHENNYGSIVLQSGELDTPAFTTRIEKLLREIKKLSDGELGITLSLGEQSIDVYRRWFDAGAHRYLLRMETSSPELYGRLHPADNLHNFHNRLNCLYALKDLGYQTGTGVMIGLPFQNTDHLADDLIFMKEFDVDMVGMGPYIEHQDTPLFEFRDKLRPIGERFDMALKMIATLRIMMKDINIAASTALQAIDPLGREKAVRVGANIIMPNMTPGRYRNDYALYENKPCSDEEPEECANCLDIRIRLADSKIGYGEWGDSKHFHARKEKS